MKKIIKSIGIGVLASILGATPVLANVNYPLESQQTVVKIYDRRGNWVADGFLSISNPGNGKIGIYMSTLCHVPVDEIEMTIAIEIESVEEKDNLIVVSDEETEEQESEENIENNEDEEEYAYG